MSKNLNQTRDAQLGVYGQAPVGTKSGDLVALGADGLIGWALTHRVTQADLDNLDATLPQGLSDGEASFELVGVHTSLNLTVVGGADQWDAVYLLPNKTYTADGAAVGAVQVGFALTARAGTGSVEVGLR